MVDCSKNGNYGCNGGLMHTAYDYIIKNGIDMESSYPYEGRDLSCRKTTGKRANVKSYTRLSGDVNDLSKLILNGPVSVAVEVNAAMQ